MTITIAKELEDHLRERAEAEGLTIEAYVERLIREDSGWSETEEEPLDKSHPEYEQIRAAVREGLEQAERGEALPAEDVLSELRAKHGISN